MRLRLNQAEVWGGSPSQYAGLSDPYARACYDEACFYVLAHDRRLEAAAKAASADPPGPTAPAPAPASAQQGATYDPERGTIRGYIPFRKETPPA